MQPIPTQPIPTQQDAVQPIPTQPVVMQPVPPQPMMAQPVPPQPIMAQPVSPAAQQTLPPSFENNLRVLESVGGLFVKQKAEALEMVTGFETCNKYKVYLTGPDCVRGKDQDAYFKAQEESDCLQRQCCGNMRAFEMKIYGPDKQPFIILKRPFKCTCCCCNLPELSIEDALGNYVGKVVNIFDCCADRFTIYDHNDMPVMTIHGDCFQWGKVCTLPMGPCAEVRYDVMNSATNSMGYIKKIFSGFIKEAMSDADSFVLSFPPDASAQFKMLLLGSVFLLDFMYFENNTNQHDHHDFD